MGGAHRERPGARDAARRRRSAAGCRGSHPAGAKLLLARHARHFAWHAELWDGLVPVLHDHPRGLGDRRPAARARPRRHSPRSPSRRPSTTTCYPSSSPPTGPGRVRRRRSPSVRSCGCSTSCSTTSTSTPRRATTSSRGADPAVRQATLRHPDVPNRFPALDAAGIVNGNSSNIRGLRCTCPDACAVPGPRAQLTSKGSLGGEGACRARRGRSRPALSHRHRPVSAADEGRRGPPRPADRAGQHRSRGDWSTGARRSPPRRSASCGAPPAWATTRSAPSCSRTSGSWCRSRRSTRRPGFRSSTSSRRATSA